MLGKTRPASPRLPGSPLKPPHGSAQDSIIVSPSPDAAQDLFGIRTEPLPAGTYQCHSLAGGATDCMFLDVHIIGAASYKDKDGKLVFENGPCAPANAAVLPGPKHAR